jgi:hypothetical protein
MSSSVRSRIVDALLHRDPVGDRQPRLTRDAHDPLNRTPFPERERDARGEPAAPDRDEDRLGLGCLLRELEPDRALARDHARVLERVHERRVRSLDVRLRRRDGRLEALSHELDHPSVGRGRLDLRHRRVLGHEDRGPAAGLACGPRDRLPVVPSARRDDPGLALPRAERRDRVVRAADLEGARALEVLGLEQHRAASEPREGLRRV